MPNPMTGAGYAPKIMPKVNIKAKPKPTATKHPMRDYGYTQTHYGSTFDKKQQAFLKKMQEMNQAPIDALKKRMGGK